MFDNAFLAASFKSYYECSRYGQISASYLLGMVIFQVFLVVLSNFDLLVMGQCAQEHHSECEHRNALYRCSFATTAVFVWLYLSESAWIRKLVTTNLQWVCNKVNDYRKRIASFDVIFGCLSFLLVFFFTPNGILEVYISIVAPMLGAAWLVYEGFVAISLPGRAHSALIKTVLPSMVNQMHDVRLYLQNNATSTAGADSDAIRRARLLTIVYATFYAIVMLYTVSMYYTDMFPSKLSTVLICTNFVLGIAAAFISLQSVVNKTLLAPTVFVLFTTSLCLQVLFLDPANPHNIEYQLAVRPPVETIGDSVAVYDSYSGLMQGYVYANDIISGAFCLLTVYHSVVYGSECTPTAVLTVLKRASHAVSKACTGSICRNASKHDKTEDAPLEEVQPHSEGGSVDRLSLRRGAIGGNAYLEGIEETAIIGAGSGSASEYSPHRAASPQVREPDEEDGLIRNESTYAEHASLLTRVAGDDGLSGAAYRASSSNSSVATSTAPPMAPFYIRMMLLVAYTPLLLTRWGATDSVGLVSEKDFRVFPKLSTLFGAGESSSVSDRIATQYTMIVILVATYVTVWCMYAFSLYCTYEVNAKYLAARKLLFQRNTFVDESSDEEDAGDLDLENHGEGAFVK